LRGWSIAEGYSVADVRSYLEAEVDRPDALQRVPIVEGDANRDWRLI
jgi:hypothetical protein